ncbi:excalibur calcium-binding domain-containing protein [[Mycobacterium] burgundiense]|uniref:Excalibur calcium-binding domain-containing protein n=2 Tax=[Mycobacterium] burgundiense TaxID=3064286 RepID=A0ABM9LLI4_9MYCO|nr:excalibur calcium-binding domain-containing protein [Mycolicibacterium sp. MU0053]
MVRTLIAAAVFGGLVLGGAATANAAPYYKNCTAARDAGAAPVYEGDPGYAPHLDRDGDGIGCE